MNRTHPAAYNTLCARPVLRRSNKWSVIPEELVGGSPGLAACCLVLNLVPLTKGVHNYHSYGSVALEGNKPVVLVNIRVHGTALLVCRSGSWIRTNIDSSKDCRPTIKRFQNMWKLYTAARGLCWFSNLAPRSGFEPKITESESVVLAIYTNREYE